MSTKGLTQTNSGGALALTQRRGCHAANYHCNSKLALVSLQQAQVNDTRTKCYAKPGAEQSTTIISIGGAGMLFYNIEFDLQEARLLLAPQKWRCNVIWVAR